MAMETILRKILDQAVLRVHMLKFSWFFVLLPFKACQFSKLMLKQYSCKLVLLNGTSKSVHCLKRQGASIPASFSCNVDLFICNTIFWSLAYELITSLEIFHMTIILQLFHSIHSGSVVTVVINILDSILIIWEPSSAECFLRHFNLQIELGTVVQGIGILKIYGLTIFQ